MSKQANKTSIQIQKKPRPREENNATGNAQYANPTAEEYSINTVSYTHLRAHET